MRHTKIIATLGPASAAPRVVDGLVAAGVDVFRLNFSHGTHDTHRAMFEAVRAATARAKRHVAILQDLSGPKIRTGALEGGRALELREGDTLDIAPGEGIGRPGLVYTPYAELVAAAAPGDRLLLDDGKIELRVTGRASGSLTTTVVNGGTLGEHKGINAPGVKLPAAAVTPKDEEDLRFGLELGVDLVALSFVQTPGDVRAARRIAESAGRHVPIVAKVERPAAVENLSAILEVADGVMVARGDLGLECPLEEVPRIQKEIIQQARGRGIPVIVATQVLESMRTEPRPTRAEVSDAATAVDQGADAIMLAGETAAGAYPVRAVQTLDAIIRDAESPGAMSALPLHETKIREVTEVLLGSRHGLAMCQAAVTLATTGQVDAIVAITHFGKTAQLLSSLRPGARIFAVTPDAAVARRLALSWGVVPLVSDAVDVHALEKPLRDEAGFAAGDVVVFINLSPDLARHDANFLTVQKLDG
jgi:pyruvate kinase